MSDALQRYLRTQVFVNISWEAGKSRVMFWNVVNQHITPALTRPWKWRGRGVGREGGELSKGSRAICARAVLYVGNATWDCQFENVSVWILGGFLLRKCGVQ